MAQTRVRPPNAPVAAPQTFPSPNSDSEQHYHRPYNVPQHAPTPAHCELWGHIERELSCRTDHALSQNPNESRRRIVFAQTAQLRKDLDDIMHNWQRKTLALWGESLKRHPDDDDDADNSFTTEPKAKRPNIFKPQSADAEDDDDDEGGKKNGGWQCLYYENDPRSYAQCGEKRYKRVSELRRHIKTHTLPHYCEKCGYRTAEERRLQSHKCEEANRKRYAPVTDEDRHKHEQLARMAVKVGQMKVILFGPDANKEGSDSASGDDGNSYHTTSNSEEEGMMPPNIPTYDTNIFPTQPEFMNFTATPPVGPLLNMSTQPPYTTYGPSSPLQPQILQSLGPMPPQNNGFRGIPIIHSPSTGSAGVYYHENDYSPNAYGAYGPDSPPSPTNPQQTSSSSPNSSSYSPPYTHIPFTSSEPMPLPPHRADSNNSLNSYLQNYFPEVTPQSQYAAPILNRRMPTSEIREMERFLASHPLTPLQRRATTYFLQQNAHFERNTLLVRLRKGNQSLSDKGKKFIRTLSTRGRKPPTKRTNSIPLAAQPEAPAAAESAAPTENTQLPTPPASPEPATPANSSPPPTTDPSPPPTTDPSPPPAAEGEPAPAIRPQPTPRQAASSKAPSAKMSFWKRLTVAKVTPTQEGAEEMGTTTIVVAGNAVRARGRWRWLFSSSSKSAAPAATAAPVTATA